MKKLISVVMLLVMVCSMAFPAAADEMAAKYTECLGRLNNYLLNAEGAYVDLNQLQKDLDELGNYSNGECALLSMYTQVLINLRESRYADCEMYLLFLQNNAQKVDAILNAHPEYSAIGSVSALKAYYDARVYEVQGNYNAAFDLYSITSMFYDSLSRAKYCYEHRSASATAVNNATQETPKPTAVPTAVRTAAPTAVPTAAPTAVPAPTAKPWPVGAMAKIVKAGNVRKGPGTNYARIDGVGVGSSFEILDCQEGPTGNDWYQIKVSGKLGWISETLTEIRGGSSSKKEHTDKKPDTDDKKTTPTPANKETTPPAQGAKWSAWSEWSTTPAYSSSTRQVETTTRTEIGTEVQYHYSRYRYIGKNGNWWYYPKFYQGDNYVRNGEYQYLTVDEPLKATGTAAGRTLYEGYWYNETEEEIEVVLDTWVEYRYRDRLN